MWFSPMRSEGRPGDDGSMDVYVVERHMVGWTAREVDELVRRVEAAREALATSGARHLGTVVMPTDEICWDLFEGTDEATVVAANAGLSLPVDRILPARTSAITP